MRGKLSAPSPQLFRASDGLRFSHSFVRLVSSRSFVPFFLTTPKRTNQETCPTTHITARVACLNLLQPFALSRTPPLPAQTPRALPTPPTSTSAPTTEPKSSGTNPIYGYQRSTSPVPLFVEPQSASRRSHHRRSATLPSALEEEEGRKGAYTALVNRDNERRGSAEDLRMHRVVSYANHLLLKLGTHRVETVLNKV